MSWGDESKNFQAILASRPELQEKYQAFLTAIESSDAVPERVFDLCRARIQQIHGIDPNAITRQEAQSLNKGDLTAFNAQEQAALVAAERFPYQHHQLTDEEVEAVKSAFGDAGCVSLLTALAFFDVTCRLDTTFQQG
jgi:hypothetical protein